MCVIAVAKKRKLNHGEIDRMWAGNPEGAGVAWAEDGLVHYRKGFMKLKDLKHFYNSRDFPFPHVVHFRIVSSGATSPEQTHPFIMSRTSPLLLSYDGLESVLFHNGTYRDWTAILAQIAVASETKIEGAVNDTRTCAIVGAFVPAWLETIAKESISRFAVLKPDGTVELMGRWDDLDTDIPVSNTYWKTRSISTTEHNWEKYGFDPSTYDDAVVAAMVRSSSGPVVTSKNGSKRPLTWKEKRADEENRLHMAAREKKYNKNARKRYVARGLAEWDKANSKKTEGKFTEIKDVRTGELVKYRIAENQGVGNVTPRFRSVFSTARIHYGD